jgi:hypothetical protein
VAVEVFRVKGTTTGNSPIILGWTSGNYSANSVAGGLREATINEVAAGNKSCAFNMPYSIGTFGRKQDDYNGGSMYDRITVYGAPFFPNRYDGINTCSNNANVPLTSPYQWDKYVGATNRGQSLGTDGGRVTTGYFGTGPVRERSLHWKIAMRTEGNITGYNSGGLSINDNGTNRYLSYSKIFGDYVSAANTRIHSAPITDSHDPRHFMSGGQVQVFDTSQQRMNISEVMQCYYDSNNEKFVITVTGDFNYNVRAQRLHIAKKFLVEAVHENNTASSNYNYNGNNMKTTLFDIDDATLSYGTATHWYSKGSGIGYRENYVPDNKYTTLTWSTPTSPFYTHSTAGSSDQTKWHILVYPLRG